jgi:hypothetical protein
MSLIVSSNTVTATVTVTGVVTGVVTGKAIFEVFPF